MCFSKRDPIMKSPIQYQRLSNTIKQMMKLVKCKREFIKHHLCYISRYVKKLNQIDMLKVQIFESFLQTDKNGNNLIREVSGGSKSILSNSYSYGQKRAFNQASGGSGSYTGNGDTDSSEGKDSSNNGGGGSGGRENGGGSGSDVVGEHDVKKVLIRKLADGRFQWFCLICKGWKDIPADFSESQALDHVSTFIYNKTDIKYSIIFVYKIEDADKIPYHCAGSNSPIKQPALKKYVQSSPSNYLVSTASPSHQNIRPIFPAILAPNVTTNYRISAPSNVPFTPTYQQLLPFNFTSLQSRLNNLSSLPVPPAMTIRPQYIIEYSQTLERVLQQIKNGKKIRSVAANENEDIKTWYYAGLVKNRKYYNYLLIDPTNLDNVTCSFQQFLDHCFYVGKGTGVRFYDHFIDTIKSGDIVHGEKETRIRDLLDKKTGVIVVKIFDHIQEEEAFNREAAMIDAFTKEQLTNDQLGSYYGRCTEWSKDQKEAFGVSCLISAHKVFQCGRHDPYLAEDFLGFED